MFTKEEIKHHKTPKKYILLEKVKPQAYYSTKTQKNTKFTTWNYATYVTQPIITVNMWNSLNKTPLVGWSLRCEIVVNVVGDDVHLVSAITKVPMIRDVWAAVVVRVERVDGTSHRPLAAVTLLAVQPDLNTSQLLNDLDNHRVRSLRAQPVSGRYCRRVTNHIHTVLNP